MGRRKRTTNIFAQKKRDKKNLKEEKPVRGTYKDIVRENDAFFRYYKEQNICPEFEWNEFILSLQSDLPTTFRLAGHSNEAVHLLDYMKTELFPNYIKAVAKLNEIDESSVAKPISLPWYPNEFAWQLNLTRKDIRRSEPLFKLHNFLIAETNVGKISRQEAVSMIPALLLDVKPHEKVLDMCASPGSKTAQLIEALHSGIKDGELPTGFIIANDVNNQRCYMLVHQAKRLKSPCLIVTNHDATSFPNLTLESNDVTQLNLKFNKILCDVPCSSDGTLRKSPDIWMKWKTSNANSLHGSQYRLLRRGVELLEIGGRIVYSTCSLNPIENEAVIQRIIDFADGAISIVDVSSYVSGLKYSAGLKEWKVASRDLEIYNTFEEVPEKYHTVINREMFPLPDKKIRRIPLQNCIRILPHQQNTGGFFVAVLEKTKSLPCEGNGISKLKRAKISPTTHVSIPESPQIRRSFYYGHKEDPYVFFEGNEELLDSISNFYEFNPQFDRKLLFTRCIVGKKKNIYYCTKTVKNIVENNKDIIKIINTGVKVFTRCDNKNMSCPFRLTQEGLEISNDIIGNARRINIEKEDLIKLLQNADPKKPFILEDLSALALSKASLFQPGSCILTYTDKSFVISLVGWRGVKSIRPYMDVDDTVHTLRLLRADISMFEKNKFQKLEQDTVPIEDTVPMEVSTQDIETN